MKINPGIFKAYDIRGVYGKDFDEELGLRLGAQFVQMRKKELRKEKLQIVVGMDMRISSPAIKEKLIQGIIGAGADVIDIGLASTPTFYFAVANYGYDGGILVSASHNPAEYNGFKMVRERAIPVSGDSGIYELRDKIMASADNPVESVLEENKGKVVLKNEVLADQVKHDLAFCRSPKIKRFKIMIDPANSMGAQYFDELFKYIDTNLVRINWELDGSFPAHEADPYKEENLIQISKKIVEEKADLGIATDGDGDRIFFIDDQGVTVEPGIVRAILSKIFLRDNPGAKICYDIRPGRITQDTITENGGVPVVTKVGHSLIKEQGIKENAVFAGESSGHYYTKMEFGFFDTPLIATLLILKELSDFDRPLSEYIRPFKRYFHSTEINSKVASVPAVLEKIKELYKDARINELDGVTIEYDDWWFNVRGSNTEPVIRLNLEARSIELMENKRDEVLRIIRG
ncbi:MAG: phosphomannomutase/phosphoglucomutase [Patescibacteria group bacterium]|jgi:phosphomannomutase